MADVIAADALIAMADRIDERLGPIPGAFADQLAVALRRAAGLIGGIRHPTGSEEFAAELVKLGAPAPWRLCDEEVGEALADNGAIAFQVDPNINMSDAAVTALASWIIVAVNTCAGFKMTPGSGSANA